jgi:serine/threonine protein phosphatase PrpC
MITYTSFGFSEIGKSHTQNEDRYLRDEKEGLFLVADGMGGHLSGETASHVAIECIKDFVIRSRTQTEEWPSIPRKDLTPEQRRLLAAVTLANRRITGLSSHPSVIRRMGTTLVGALLEGEHLAVVNVGDSRVYRIRAGQIAQITTDHSFVGEQQKSGLISREEARVHPQRNVLTSALGLGENPQMDFYLPDISPGDLYLLCSDGLHAALRDEEILAITLSIPDGALYKIGLSLVLKATLAGGRDDTTVILIAFSQVDQR